MHRDRLFSGANPAALRDAAYTVITRTQDRPEIQLRAMAIALVCSCRALNVNVRELLESTERVTKEIDEPYVATFRALDAYAKNEMGRFS